MHHIIISHLFIHPLCPMYTRLHIFTLYSIVTNEWENKNYVLNKHNGERDKMFCTKLNKHDICDVIKIWCLFTQIMNNLCFEISFIFLFSFIHCGNVIKKILLIHKHYSNNFFSWFLVIKNFQGCFFKKKSFISTFFTFVALRQKMTNTLM